MSHSRVMFAVIVLATLSAGARADATVDSAVIGPARADATSVVSPRGVHVGVILPNAGGVAVTFDGVAGPRYDEIITPTRAAIDPRPAYAASFGTSPMPVGQAITFSRDGSRHAYIARTGQEWAVIVDDKELFRVPAGSLKAGDVQVAMEFTGDSGRHLLFALGIKGQPQDLWVDGTKLPFPFLSAGGGGEGTTDPTISADGEHYACVTAGPKPQLILDGKDAGYFADEPRFSPDGSTLYAISRGKTEEVLLANGKLVGTAPHILALYLPAKGASWLAVASAASSAGTMNYYCLLNGKKIDATQSASRPTVALSADGGHYAAACTTSPGHEFVVFDGNKGHAYDSIFQPPAASLLTFSQDGPHLGFIATSRGKSFAVMNGGESAAFDTSTAKFIFSADGRHNATFGQIAKTDALFIDGKHETLPRPVIFSTFSFGAQGAHHAVVAGDTIWEDGKSTGLIGRFLFSPDGKHLAVIGRDPSHKKAGIFLDGRLLAPAVPEDVRCLAFTPESGHLCWLAQEPDLAPDAARGARAWVTYVDGRSAARFQRNTATDRYLISVTGMQTMQIPAWQMQMDGAILCAGPVGVNLVRFSIKPGGVASP